MIPISTDSPIRRTPWVNYGLIAVNVLVFFVDHWFAGSAPTREGLGRFIELGVLQGDEPRVYQFFTYQFLHGGFAHIGGNMLFLWVFGNPVNAKMGHGPYVMFYLAGGVFAAVGYAMANDSPMIGASGSIAAVTTAYLALFPRSHVTILYWWFIIGTFELPSMILIIFKMIIWDNILAPSWIEAQRVAFDAHLAGYGFGFVAVILMLALRVLPRDQFDIVALMRRWMQRQSMRRAMTSPEAQARARLGRVARPVSVDDLNVRAVEGGPPDQIGELRGQISEALSRSDRETAAGLYEKILEIDPRQVLARSQQMEVANQLYRLNRLPQAAAAYEKFLNQYPRSPEVSHVKLLLGIIYARDLQQYEVAQEHLKASLDNIVDDHRREQCEHWLKVVAEALGRPATGG